MPRAFAGISAFALLFAMHAPGFISPAFAQAPAVTDGDEDDGDEVGGDIIVTAQKRSERLVDVPMSIAVVGEEELAQRGVSTLQDLSFAVPGLTMSEVGGPGSYTIFLRGLANQSGSGTLVSLYLDEAPLSLSGYDQMSPAVLDFERVEVLKGPQGTLYGQGSAGGTIRFITNKPRLDRVEGSVEAEGFSVSHGDVGGRVTGVINLPLVQDKLALRVAASYEGGGGWIDQPEAGIKNGNGTELLTARASLLWRPVEEFQAKAMVQIHRADTELGLGYEEPDRTVDIGVDRSLKLIPKDFNFTVYNLEMSYDLGFATISSSTSYLDHHQTFPYSYIPRPGNLSNGFVEGISDSRTSKADQFSQELRLSSGDGPFKWTIGGYYTEGKRSFVELYRYIFAPAGDLYSGGGTVYTGYYGSGGKSTTYSLFGDASYELTDRFSLGAGLRYFRDEQESFSEYALGTGEILKATFTSVDPRFYASYKYSDRANVYASVAKGFRSGGFNSAPFDPYDPEKAWTYELGTKGSTADGVLQFDVAAFLTKYDDMVRRRQVLVDGFFLQELSNVGKVEVKGIEVGLSVRPGGGWSFSASGGYTDAKIVSTDPEDVVNIPGDRVDYTPKFSGTFSVNKDFSLGDDMPAFARIDYSYRDRVSYIDRSSFAASALPQVSDAISLVNMTVGATVGGVDLSVYVRNLFDTNKAIDPYIGWANSNRTRPRTVGFKVGHKF